MNLNYNHVVTAMGIVGQEFGMNNNVLSLPHDV